jgi:hypothetical protein
MARGSWSCSRQAAKQVDGIAHRIDPQSNAAPLDGIAFASDQVLNRGDDVVERVRRLLPEDPAAELAGLL